MSRRQNDAPASLEGLDATAPPVSEDMAERVKLRIMRGVYAPGQRLVEADLIKEFGAGRSRVRETLKTLVGEGYLELRENSGVRVRRLTRKEALEIGKVREVLEGLAVRQTVENGLSSEDRKQLGAIQKQLNAAMTDLDLERYNRHSADYHAFFLSRSQNGYLALMIERLRIPLFRIQFHAAISQDSMLARHACTRRITAAALEGDAAKAEAEMRLYMDGGNKRLAQSADDLFG